MLSIYSLSLPDEGGENKSNQFLSFQWNFLKILTEARKFIFFMDLIGGGQGSRHRSSDSVLLALSSAFSSSENGGHIRIS